MSDDKDRPVLRQTPYGWLAQSRGDFPRIAVSAATAEETEALYRQRRAEWRRVAALPDVPYAYEVPASSGGSVGVTG